MRTIGTLATPGTFTSAGAPLVGRTVANGQFWKAVAQFASFDDLRFFIGENADIAWLEALAADWRVPDGRLVVHHAWQLPELLRRGAIGVLHHGSHVERLYDLFAVRDRYASKPTPVTGLIHSLSYPRVHQELARLALIGAAPTDAIFCSSSAGKKALELSFDAVDTAGQPRGLLPMSRPQLPLVPLGVELASVCGGDRSGARSRLDISANATVFTCLARFTEYDKVDLFPLLEVFARIVREPGTVSEPYLVLAGARQGTKTPEMLELWSRALGIADRIRLRMDFPDSEKKDLLAASDVFVSPVDNIQETFGQSVIEAMAAGLPCVVSDFDGYKDTVTEDVGVRVPARLGVDWSELSELAPLLYERPLHLVLGQSVEVDPDALEAALRKVGGDRTLREELGRNAARRAKERYAWPVVVKQYEAEWKRLSEVAWKPKPSSHPLRLDLGKVFGHFADPARSHDSTLQRTEFSRSSAQPWVIYPELQTLITNDDVMAILEYCTTPHSLRDVTEFVTQRLQDRPGWVAGFIVNWSLKHRLLRAT